MSDQTQEEEVQTEEVPSEAPAPEAPPETEAPAAPAEGDTPPAEAPAEAGTPESDPQAYAPNYNYKVYGEEKQFEEWLQPLLVNKDVEDYFRSVHEKAGGFDGLKEKHETAKTQHEEVYKHIQEHYVPMEDAITKLRDSVGRGDFAKFFEQAGIKKSQVMDWAVKQAQYTEMEPEQRAAVDAKLRMERENHELQNQNKSLTNQRYEDQVNQRSRELDLTLDDPAVNQVMREFDQRKGRIGAFREEVIAYGNGRYNSSQQDLSARDAVNGVLSLMGVGSNGATPAQPQAQPTTSVVRPVQNKPVIPNIDGRATSPIGKKKYTNLDELREYANNFDK